MEEIAESERESERERETDREWRGKTVTILLSPLASLRSASVRLYIQFLPPSMDTHAQSQAHAPTHTHTHTQTLNRTH